MAKVELRSLKRIYEDGTEAVKGVDLTVEDGEFLVLLGPSGCGKTTLLRTIAGLDPPSEGKILFDGTDVSDWIPRKRNTAMVFQNYSLYPDRSVYRNIAFPLESLHVKEEEIDRRVRETAKLLDLTELLNRRPRTLSGGQKQRTALARALVREPSVFLLDEPLSNLDADMRAALRQDLVQIQKRIGTTFIYVTHDQTEAMEMGSRIAVMHDGRIEQSGTPMEVYHNPETVFTASFIGRPKMNLFSGTAQAGENEVRIALPVGTASVRKERFLRIPESGSGITVGIRPEDFRIAQDGDGGFRILAEVETVVPMGARALAECHSAAGEDGQTVRAAGFSALIGGKIPASGEVLSLSVREEDLYLFDTADGRSVRTPVPVRDLPPVTGQGRLRTEEKKETRPSGIAHFFQVLLNEWWELFKLNLLFLVSCLGIITIPAALTALNKVCIMMEEEEVHILRKDYWNAFRKDFLRSLGGGAILFGLMGLFSYVALLYARFAVSRSYLIFLGAVMVFLAIVVFMTGIYFFPMNAKVDLPCGILLRNSFLLAVTGVKRTIPAVLISLLSYAVCGIGLWPYSFVYIAVFMFSFTTLINVFLVYPAIRQRVIIKE